VLEVGEMGGKGRRRDPCTYEAFRGFIVYAKQTLDKLLWQCMNELQEFSPAELLSCLEWETGSAPDYYSFYNHVIRPLFKKGVINKRKRGRYVLVKNIDLTEVLSSGWFESGASEGGCVSVRVRSHVISGSLLEAYASYLFYCRVLCASVVRLLFREKLKALGVREAVLRRVERCVSRAVKSVRVEGIVGKPGGHRKKGEASRELKWGYGNEENGFDLRICVGRVFVPLLRHWKVYKGEIIGSCRCEEADSRGGEAG
jgi:hypothetical protein